MTDKLKMRK